MKTDRKIKAEKSPPKIKAAKGNSRELSRPNGKHLLAVYEHIPVGIVEASLDGRYMDVNQEFCRILGYSRRELLRRGIKDCTHDDDYGIDVRLYEQLIGGKIPFYRIEKRYVRKDGEIIWVEITRSLVCDEEGKPIYTVGVVLDISDRKDVERVLRESVERLRLATGAAQMFMWEWDFQTESYIIADSFEQVLGFSAGLLPKNKFETLWALSPEEDIERISGAFENAVELQGDIRAVPIRVINPENDQIVWLEISAKIVYDSKGNPERMFGVAQNITESKKARDEIAVISRMPEENPHPVMRLTPEGTVRYANPAARPLVDYWTQRAGQPIPEEVQKAITEAFTSGLKPEFELEYGGKFFSCTLAPVPTAGYVNLYASDITERRQAEEQLRESEERFRALVSQATAGISETDLEGRLIFVNAAFCEMLGYSEVELLGKTIWELTFAEDLEENKRLFKRMVDQDNPYQFEKRFIRKDGSVLWTSVSVTVIHDSAGEPKGGVGVVLNIEKRKQAETALAEYARQQESLYRLSDELHHTESLTAVFDASLDAILKALQCDRASILLYDDANVMRFVAWRGLSEDYRKATDGHSPWKPDERDPQPVVMDDVRAAELSASLRAVIQAEGIASLAFIPLVSNGTLIGKFMVYFDAPHAFEEGELDLGQTIARLLASAIDRKRADVQLRESEQRYRAVVESQSEMLCRFRPDGTILFVNGAYARARGTTPEDLASRNFWGFIAEEDRASVQAMLDSLSPEEPQVQIENRFDTRDGERWTLWTNRALSFDANGRWLEAQSSGIDITERKQVEEALRASEERMRLATDAAGMFAWEFDVPSQQFTVSENFAEAMSFPAELISTDSMDALLQLSPAEDSLTVQEMMSKAFERQEDLRDLQYRIINPVNGQVIWLEMNARTIYDREGKPERMYGVSQNITERKRIEEALAHERELLSRIFESIPVMLTIYDPSSKLMRLNRQFEQLIGWSSDDAAGISLMETIYPDRQYRERVAQFMDRCVENEWMDIQMRTRDGRTLETSWSNIRLSNDMRVGIGIDITERKRAEEALRESEERYRGIVNQTIGGISETDLTGKFIMVNDRYCEITGYSRQQLLNEMRMQDVTHPDDLPKNLELFGRLMAEGTSFEIEKRYIRSNGSVVWVHNSVSAITDAHGKPKSAVAAVIDVTERKRAEEALRASESLYRTIARSIPGGGVYVVDKDFRYLVAEGPVTEAFGLSREMLEGRTVIESFPDERGARMEDRLRRTFAGETVSFETEHAGRFYWTQQAPLLDSIGHAIIVTLDITERKRAEEALRQSEERFAHFMQHLPGLAWIKDIQGRYVYANAAAEKAFNMPSEMLYGLRDEDIFPAEVAEQFRRNDELALQDEKGVQVIETLVHADGVLHSSLVSKFPIPGPDGSTSLIGGTAFDVTERLRAEEALRESEERFRAILRQATAGIVRKDAEGRLIFVNEAFCNMLGRTETELLGRTMWDFMHPDDIAENKRSYERLMLEGTPFKLERRLLRKDGTVIWVDASVSPIVDSTGKSQSAVTVEVDITGHKQAVESLRASEERYRNLFELVPVAVYSCDANGLIQEYNHRAVDLWGREPKKNDPSERYCGSYKIFYPDGRFMPPEQCPMARALKRETLQPYEFEILVEREDGQRRNVVAHPLILRNEYGEITGAINCLYDITERKQAEEALQQLNLQLEERVLSRTAKLRAVNQTLRDEITERQRIEDALRKSEAAARENEEKLSTLFELLPVGISFLDLQGQIIQMNTALAHILKMPKARGSTEPELSRKYIRANGTMMPPGEIASRRALAEGKTVYNVETGVILEDNEVVWTSVSAAPVNVADVGAVVVTVDITESKRAERALQESRERLQVLSQRLVEVQEDERRAIARELHDRVGQTLAALNINLIIISGQLGGKVDEQISTRLNDSMKLVAETIALVRDVMSNLRPSVLDDYGLEAAVESHLTQFTSRYEIQTRFEKPEQPIPRLGPSIEMTFLRIAQEALMNTVKHAQASQVRLTLRREENTICMIVQDNGLGITSWQNANRPGSHGLTIMRERAEAFGGSLKLNSVPGKGTTVEVKIPIDTSDLSPSEKEKNQ